MQNITPKRTISMLLALIMIFSIAAIPVMAAPPTNSGSSGSITMTPVSITSDSATVTVAGYENLSGGTLYVLIGNKSDMYGDPRIIATAPFTGPDSYDLTFNGKYELKEGDTLLPYIYKYDGDTDSLVYKDGEIVTVSAGSVTPADAITMTPVTTSSNQATVTVTGHEAMKGGTLYVLIGNKSDMYGDPRIIATAPFTGPNSYDLTFNGKYELKEGDTLLPYIYKYDGDTDSLVYKDGEIVTVTAGSSQPEIQPGKTPFEILANCKVQMMKDGAVRTDPFREHEGSVDVKVQLDPSVESCSLNIYAFASTTSFDPESTHNISLWGGTVTNGTEQTCTFTADKLPKLEVGYSIAASLYVCVDPDTDYYLSSNSQVLEIVDENGQGFEPYAYPDASIAETELQAGAQTLHLNLTGDNRIFQAAKAQKTTINLAVCQYPAEDEFDFESERQISLYSRQDITAPISNEEIRLDSPLKPGYRVRAVVYWSQNVELHLVKGNDYEHVFQCPDDSVLISGQPEVIEPAVSIDTKLTPSAKNILVTSSGTIPAGSRLLIKSYDADASVVLFQGTLVASADAAPSVTVVPAEGTLATGRQVVAFILNAGQIVAQSAVSVVVKDAPPAPVGTIALTTEVTPDSTDVTVAVSGYENMTGGQLFLIRGQDMYDNTKIIGSSRFTGPGEFHIEIRENTVLTPGEEIMPYLYFYNADTDRTEYKPGTVTNVVNGTEPEVKPGTTPDEILANCSAVLMQNGKPRTENFRENDTSVQVKVQLDPGVKKCYMTLFAYASNTHFDPDGSHNIRLWGDFVTDGQTADCSFSESALPLKPGYSVIACLNVPVGPDWFRPVNSQAIPIVDENGQGFEDYDPYPDAEIVETTLEAGAETLHISLKADARLFAAAKEGKTSLNIAVAQYPDGDDFDFESADQISLYSEHRIKEPVVNREIQLSEPLKAGYRVRAVVYWEQNVELHLVKGNDYEAMFHRPDDSVLVSGEAEKPEPAQLTAAISGPVTPASASVSVRITGTIPAGSRLLVKAYGDNAPVELSKGTLVGAGEAAATVTLTPEKDVLKTGSKLVAFVLNAGKIVAQSQPLFVGKDTPIPQGAIVINEVITADTQTATVTISGCEEFAGGRLILTIGDSVYNDQQLANVAFTGAGTYTVKFSSAYTLSAGDKVLPYLYLGTVTPEKYLPGTVSVVAGSNVPEELSVSVTGTVKTDSKTVMVHTAGSIPSGALVLVKAFSAQDPISYDKGTPVSLPVTAGADVSVTPNAGALKEGYRLVAFILDKGTAIAQSEPVTIVKGGDEEIAAVSVKFTDRIVTAGDTKVNASAQWDKELGNQAKYVLYQFTGESLDKASAVKLYEGTVYHSYRNMTMNVAGRLQVGSKLQVVLTVGGREAVSNVITVEPAPNWGVPSATLDVAYVAADAVSIPVYVQYSDEYLTMGDDFYCDVTLYQFSGDILDDEFAENEWWENPNYATRIGQINSRMGDETNGHVSVPVLENAVLEPGSRIIVKLRLPHTEWEGEEEDFLSMSVPVVEAGQEPLPERIVLLNLGEDTERGRQLRSILKDLGMEAYTVENKDLDEMAGYVAGLPGYEMTPGDYTDHVYSTEFMLMCNLSETRLDQFLAAMRNADLFIGHKAVMTQVTKDLQLYEIVDLITDEHMEVTRAALSKQVEDAEALKEADYGSHPDWNRLQASVAAAKELLADEQTEAAVLEAARRELKTLYDSVLSGTSQVTYTKVEEIPATVTQTGMKEHFVGSDGKLYVNLDGIMTEVQKADLIIPCLPVAPADPDHSLEDFRDVSSQNWFYEDVRYVYEKGLMTGTCDTRFAPALSATRGMLITILYRLAGSPAVSASVSFGDVNPDAYYYPALLWAVDAGLAAGYEDNTFRADRFVTREEAVTFLYRFMIHMNRPVAAGSLDGFADASAVSAFARQSMSWAVGSGLMDGRTPDTLVPAATATRAEVAAMIHRFCEM